jgi:hypothetical protein
MNSRRSNHARAAFLALTGVSLTGCLAWDEAWTDSARKDCKAIPNSQDQAACMERVDALIRERDHGASARPAPP